MGISSGDGINQSIRNYFNSPLSLNNKPSSLKNEEKAQPSYFEDSSSISGQEPDADYLAGKKLAQQSIKYGSPVQRKQNTNNNPQKDVKVNYWQQDPSVGGPINGTIPKDMIGNNLSGRNFYVEDKENQLATPNKNGNYNHYDRNSPQAAQVNALYWAEKSSQTLNGYSNRDSGVGWDNGEKIKIDMVRDKTNNFDQNVGGCYKYDDNSIRNTYNDNIKLNSEKFGLKDYTVNLARSADGMSHEVGHAKVFAMKPDINYNSSHDETGSAHEALADSMSMLCITQDDGTVKDIINETGGDLSKENRMSNIMEDAGRIREDKDRKSAKTPAQTEIYKNRKKPVEDRPYWRSALNNLKYQPPGELPSLGKGESPFDFDPNSAVKEPHNISRIFSGGFYDSWNNIYKNNLEKMKSDPKQLDKPLTNTQKEEAFKNSRDTIGPLLMESIDMQPPTNMTFKGLALGMIKADEMKNGGVNRQDLIYGFKGKNIINDDDIKKFDEEQKNMPDVRINKMPESKEEGKELLSKNQDKLGVNPGNYEYLRAFKDRDENTYINYKATDGLDRITTNPKGEQQSTTYYGGMTLVFDSNGRQIYKSVDNLHELGYESYFMN